MTALSADAADLIAQGYGDRRLAGALSITRHAARALIREAELSKAVRVPAVVAAAVAGVSFYDAARQALTQAKTLAEVKDVGDKAMALKEYARRANDRTMEIDAAELRIRAERRLGEMVAATELCKGGRPAKDSETGRDTRPVSPPSLADLNISKDLSSRAQRLAALPESTIEARIAGWRDSAERGAGRVTVNLLRDGPINGARSVMAARAEPDDSLDFFPTPPWATRALMEVVLPHAGISGFGTAWEPACGEGHISKVLSEYCSFVRATDVFDYGIGADRIDFLRQESMPFAPDWIITNPPFTDGMAERFALRAIARATTVALFVRSQWAVEGGERYETIFKPHPPTLCAFFSERVNLCKGRWDPDGSTIGTKPRLALALMLYLGVRRGDAVMLGRQHVRDGEIRFVPRKTSHAKMRMLELPIHPELASIIAASSCGDLTFLVTEHGKPFTANGFGNWFRDQCDRAKLPECSAHGLRKARATAMAERGATDRQLMASFGWESSRQATTYTAAADRKRLAADAARLMEDDQTVNTDCPTPLPQPKKA